MELTARLVRSDFISVTFEFSGGRISCVANTSLEHCIEVTSIAEAFEFLTRWGQKPDIHTYKFYRPPLYGTPRPPFCIAFLSGRNF